MLKPLLIALGALVLTIASSWTERVGPDQAVYCALGKSSDGHEIWCPEPVLNGGWPAPYLYDRAGISVERQLAFIEDSCRTGPFLADSAFFALVLILIFRLFSSFFRRLRGKRAEEGTGLNSPPS